MAFRWYGIVGFIPLIVISVAFAILGLLFFIFQLPLEVIVELLIAAGTIWLIVIAVLLFVSMACASIQVRELFKSESDDLSVLEQKVCALMTASNKAIASDVGQPGQDDPAVLNAALDTARGSAPVPICTDKTMGQNTMESRISRMENALVNFTGPQLKKTYDKTVPCVSEGFEDDSLAARIQVIKTLVDKQTSALLVPIQKKEAEVKAGNLSECEKKKGTKAAVTPSS